MLAGNDENHSIGERLFCVSEATVFLSPKKVNWFYFVQAKMPIDYTGIFYKQTSLITIKF